MFKKRFVTVLVVISMLAIVPAVATAKGPGGGGHTETVGNNLSFPVIWSEGVKLSLPGTMLVTSLTVPYWDYSVSCIASDGTEIQGYVYAQKVVGNVWQAENADGVGITTINEIDWGDSLESVDMKVGRPVRVELSLYKILPEPETLTGYRMNMLANPSSKDEVQGVCSTGNPIDEYGNYIDNGAAVITYESSEATVYTPTAELIIQKITGEISTLSWGGTQWIGEIGNPIDVSFSGELNVGGKVIYGLSTGGWKPTEVGVYRITFYMPPEGRTVFDDATSIRVSAETESATLAEEGGDVGGEAFVVPSNNLTYIDVTVVGGGGGGRP